MDGSLKGHDYFIQVFKNLVFLVVHKHNMHLGPVQEHPGHQEPVRDPVRPRDNRRRHAPQPRGGHRPLGRPRREEPSCHVILQHYISLFSIYLSIDSEPHDDITVRLQG